MILHGFVYCVNNLWGRSEVPLNFFQRRQAGQESLNPGFFKGYGQLLVILRRAAIHYYARAELAVTDVVADP